MSHFGWTLTNNFVKTCAAASIIVGSLFLGAPAYATATAVPLSTAEAFAVLGGQSVTNTGSTVVTGDLGVSPGTSVTGFPPGAVNGSIHSADPVASQAQSDLTTAYNNAAGQAPDAAIVADLGGQTLVPGVYNAAAPFPSIGLTGTLTLNAKGNPSAVWVIQAESTLTMASDSRVRLINGASACNVFWQVGSSATLGPRSKMVGTVMAQQSITANTDATVQGRLLARVGSVTLDANRVTKPNCAVAPVNHAPVATDGAVNTDFETPVDFTAKAVDADGDSLTYTFGPVGGIGGTVMCAAVGSPNCTYTPPAGKSGTATMTFTASDGSLTDSGTITFIVEAKDAGPTPGPPPGLNPPGSPGLNPPGSPGLNPPGSPGLNPPGSPGVFVPIGGGSGSANPPGQGLPNTGGTYAQIGWLGAVLIAAGAAALLVSSRKRGLHRA